jgi:hypothetical protein
MRRPGSYDETQGRRQNTAKEKTMTHTLARIGRRFAAIVAECNYAQNRATSLRNTPERFL